jgi:hypothetical protein
VSAFSSCTSQNVKSRDQLRFQFQPRALDIVKHDKNGHE